MSSYVYTYRHIYNICGHRIVYLPRQLLDAWGQTRYLSDVPHHYAVLLHGHRPIYFARAGHHKNRMMARVPGKLVQSAQRQIKELA